MTAFRLSDLATATSDDDVEVAMAYAMLISSVNQDRRPNPFGGWWRITPESWMVEVDGHRLWAISSRHKALLLADDKKGVCQRCHWPHTDETEVVALGVGRVDAMEALRRLT